MTAINITASNIDGLCLLLLLRLHLESGIFVLQLLDEQVVQHSWWLSQIPISVEFISLEQIWVNVPFDLIIRHESVAYAQYFDWLIDREVEFAPLLWWHCRRPLGNSNVLQEDSPLTGQNEHCCLLLAQEDISWGVFRHPRVTESPTYRISNGRYTEN